MARNFWYTRRSFQRDELKNRIMNWNSRVHHQFSERISFGNDAYCRYVICAIISMLFCTKFCRSENNQLLGTLFRSVLSVHIVCVALFSSVLYLHLHMNKEANNARTFVICMRERKAEEGAQTDSKYLSRFASTIFTAKLGIPAHNIKESIQKCRATFHMKCAERNTTIPWVHTR